jgi:hypothetical protein
MAQKQIAPTTTMIRTPIRSEMIAMSLSSDLLLPGEHPEAPAGRQGQVAHSQASPLLLSWQSASSKAKNRACTSRKICSSEIVPFRM